MARSTSAASLSLTSGPARRSRPAGALATEASAARVRRRAGARARPRPGCRPSRAPRRTPPRPPPTGSATRPKPDGVPALVDPERGDRRDHVVGDVVGLRQCGLLGRAGEERVVVAQPHPRALLVAAPRRSAAASVDDVGAPRVAVGASGGCARGTGRRRRPARRGRPAVARPWSRRRGRGRARSSAAVDVSTLVVDAGHGRVAPRATTPAGRRPAPATTASTCRPRSRSREDRPTARRTSRGVDGPAGRAAAAATASGRRHGGSVEAGRRRDRGRLGPGSALPAPSQRVAEVEAVGRAGAGDQRERRARRGPAQRQRAGAVASVTLRPPVAPSRLRVRAHCAGDWRAGPDRARDVGVRRAGG